MCLEITLTKNTGPIRVKTSYVTALGLSEGGQKQLMSNKKSRIWETLNLSKFSDSSTNTKTNRNGQKEKEQKKK